MEIIETPVFTRQAMDLWSEDEYRAFQIALLERPDAGDVIKGSGGLRKIRWRHGGKGKRSGVRVIYYRYVEKHQLYLLLAYEKQDQDDLTKEQVKKLRDLI